MSDEIRCASYLAQETDLSGVSVTVTITVPADCWWKDQRESLEIAQMTASRAMSSIRTSQERAPF